MTKDWRIYNGKKSSDCKSTLADIKDTKPNWRDKTKADHNAKTFDLFDNNDLVNAVNAAIYLRRPLLVTGKPGIGKSSLAKSIAEELTTSKRPFHWQITSKSTLKEGLYSYDALARLQDLQMKKIYHELGETRRSKKINTNIGNYIKLGALGKAFFSTEPCVVLIDEIDKSDLDLPNDLLHIFEEQDFEIDEVKRSKEKDIKVDGYHIPDDGKIECQGDFPIILMTSNGERDFPPAFLRRCISVNISLPDNKEEQVKLLTKMVLGHFDDNTFIDEADNKLKERLTDLVSIFVDLKVDDGILLSNDQLLNAAFLVLNSDMGIEDFKTSLLSALE